MFYYRSCYNHLRIIFGLNFPNLPSYIKKQGDYVKAEPLLLEAVEGRRKKRGDSHPHTIQSLTVSLTSMKSKTILKKSKSGEQNWNILKILKSKMSLLNDPNILTYKTPCYLDKSCIQNVSAHINFSLLVADKYQFFS